MQEELFGNEICPSCSAKFEGKFCSNCGEKKISRKDLTLGHFLEEAVDIFTHFDSKFFRSFKTVMIKPGELTVDFINGKRKPFMKPLQLFLLVNIAYFLLVTFGLGYNTFTTPLENHLHKNELYNTWATEKVNQLLVEKGMTYAAFEESFNHHVTIYSKTLIIILIPMYAFLFQLFFIHRKKYFTEHLVTATHFMTFFLLFSGLVLPIFAILFSLIGKISPEVNNVLSSDFVISIIALMFIGYYTYKMFRKVYESGIIYSSFAAVLLSLGFYKIIWIYRLLLFVVGCKSV